jgi:hypothetical protein
MLDDGILVSNDPDFHDGTPLWELPATVLGQLNRTDTESATSRIDVSLAMKNLVQSNSWYAHVIVGVFTEYHIEYAQERDLTPAAYRKEITRAVDALTKEMNRINQYRSDEFEGIGRRGRRTLEQYL